jgi:dipeptidyl-peptidase-3
MESLQESVVGKNGVTDEDFQSFLAYGSGVYTNLGNYKGYGDTKIVPDLELKHFEAIVHGSEAFKNDPITLHNLWNSVKGSMFNLEDKYKQLGLGDEGVTTYFTPNCNQEDAELVNRYMKSKNIECKYQIKKYYLKFN